MNVDAASDQEPLHEIAQLAFAELLTPHLGDSVLFFTDILGMEVVHSEGASVYLRSYEDPYRYSLQLTESPAAGPGTTTFRTFSPQALARRVDVIERAGLGQGWTNQAFGRGRSYRFQSPDGHQMELVWDVEPAKVPDATKTLLLNRPSRRPLKGVPVRRLDHINFLAKDPSANVEAMIELLGFRLTEQVVGKDETMKAAWLRVSNLTHEVAFMIDAKGARGRLHHLAFWYGSPTYLMDVADICLDAGITVDAGPGKHGPSQAHYLYVWEPGGNRIELFGDVGYLIFDPSWKTVTWRDEDIGRRGHGSILSREFYIEGSPSIPNT
jgi:catechol 2,3-dioxygenase